MTVSSNGTPALAVETGSNSPSVTATWPGGATAPASGHLMVAIVCVYGVTSGDSAFGTAPSGWTLGASTSSVGSLIGYYTKVATGSDSAPVFTGTSAGTAGDAQMTVIVYDLSDSGGGTPALLTNGTDTATTGGVAAPVTIGNVLASGSLGLASALAGQGATTNTTSWTTPSHWTLAADQTATARSQCAHYYTTNTTALTTGDTVAPTLTASRTTTSVVGLVILIGVPAAQFGTISDNFPGSSLNGTLWQDTGSSGTVVVSSNTVSINLPIETGGAGYYTWIVTNAAYSLSNDSVVVELSSCTTSVTDFYAFFSLNFGANAFALNWEVDAGASPNINANYVNDYTETSVYSAAYSSPSTTYKWLMIDNKTANTITWSYSSDGSTWHTAGTVALATISGFINISAMQLQLQSSTDSNLATASSSVWANVNNNSTSATVTTTVVAGTASFPSVTVNEGISRTPSVTAAVTSFPAPAIRADSYITTAVVSATATITAAVYFPVTATVVAGTATLGASVTLPKILTLQDPFNGIMLDSYWIPFGLFTETPAPPAMECAAAFPPVTITDVASVTTANIACITTMPTVTVVTGTNAHISPVTITGAAGFVTPPVGGGVAIHPAVLSVATTFPASTQHTSVNKTTTVVSAVTTFPAPSKVGPTATTLFLDTFTGIANNALPSAAKWAITNFTTYNVSHDPTLGSCNYVQSTKNIYVNTSAGADSTPALVFAVTTRTGASTITPANGAYVSARIATWGNDLEDKVRSGFSEFSAYWGTFTVVAKMDTAQGMWPAIWTYGAVSQWPLAGELDLMENFGTSASLTLGYGNINGPTTTGSAGINTNFGIDSGQASGTNNVIHNASGSINDGSFHTYKMVVPQDCNEVYFYLDGTPYTNVSGYPAGEITSAEWKSKASSAGFPNAVWPYGSASPQGIVLNVDVGGSEDVAGVGFPASGQTYPLLVMTISSVSWTQP